MRSLSTKNHLIKKHHLIKNLLITTALTLIVTAGAALAGPAAPPDDPIAAAIPVPEPADVPPPTAADVAPPPATTPKPETRSVTIAPAGPSVDHSVDQLVPMPETADVPPPTAKDIAVDTKAAPSSPAAASDKPATDKPASVAAPSTVASPNQPVADKLAELTAKLDRFTDRRPDRQAITSFYKERAFAPMWIDNGALNDRAKSAIAKLKGADADGLDPDDYAIPTLASDTPQALAEAELRLTVATMTYARHAQAGRIHPYRVTPDVSYPVNTPEPADVLAKLAGAKDVTATLDAFNPSYPGFQALRKKLAEARGQIEAPPTIRIADGPTLKAGKKTDPRVPMLRERLGVSGDPADMTYDKPLAEAVKAFQKAHGLPASGNLTPATVAALNGIHRGSDVDTIIVNLERLRWLPRDLGKTYVMVNIPDYSLRVIRDHSLVWQTRIVVGQAHKQTPLLSAEMKFITVNPTWNVPPSIIQNEYLPALRNDPEAMTRIGLKVSYNPDGSVHISQPPGDRNALGRIRFNFPNKFLVYQHDTPDKKLFAFDKRAFSHGCMRVQDPIKYAEVLLGILMPKEGYTQERIRRLFGNAEIDIKFPTFLPVHLTYQTAYVDDAGNLVIRDDVYGLDAKERIAMRGDHRVAETSPGEPRRESYKPAKLAKRQNDPRQAAGGDNGFWFFGRLFQ